jgi:hypothetical protein
MQLNVFGAFAAAKIEIEHVANQIAIGVPFGRVAGTKLSINKLPQSATLKLFIHEMDARKGV